MSAVSLFVIAGLVLVFVVFVIRFVFDFMAAILAGIDLLLRATLRWPPR